MAVPGFNGLTVAAFESRMAGEMTRLIEHAGGRPLVTPALREVPLEDNHLAIQFGRRLITTGIDLLICLTGVGTTALFDLLFRLHNPAAITAALRRTTLLARGSKTVAALKALGFPPTVTVPEPNTWRDIVQVLDTHRPVRGLHTAVQEYGTSNEELLQALRQRGAEVIAVPIYRWALPADVTPLRHAIGDLAADRVQVLLITNAAQIDHVMQLAAMDGMTAALLAASRNMVVASIGPSASERLRHHGLSVDFEPSRSKLGIFVNETAAHAPRLWKEKSSR